MAHDVFISYSHTDKAVADAICASLEARRIRCWYAPRNIATGESWAGAIPRAIEAARVFVLVFTDNANASGQVVREVNLAVSAGLTIIPYRLTRAEPSGDMGYYLGPVHWLDARNEKQTKAIEELTKRCAAILSGRAESGQSSAAKDSPKGRLLIPVLCAAAVVAVLAVALLLRPVKPVEPAAVAPTETVGVETASTDMAPVYEDSFSVFPNLDAGVGDVVTFGHSITEGGERPEALSWRVLARDANNMLLIAERALDSRAFNASDEDIAWETCSLRQWLNGEFLNQAFTAAEQACITASTVTADENQYEESNQGADTTDKVYLLSMAEAERYFQSDAERRIKATDSVYTQENPPVHEWNKTCYWWLRTMGENNRMATYVSQSGTIMNRGESTHYVDLGILPVVRVNVYSVVTASGLVGTNE